MKRAFVALAVLLAGIPAGALAQDAATKAAEPPSAPERKELNLRLDEPRGRGMINFGPARIEAPGSGLPTLGDDARRIELPKPSESPRSSPYPKGSGPEQSNAEAMR